MRIGTADLDERVFVVAEVANNHEGDVELAAELVGLAAKAGADAVKFQTMVPERQVAGNQPQRLEELKRFCLSQEDFIRLADEAARQGIIFLSTPFDVASARFLLPLVPAYKIASGDNNHWPLLRAVAATGKPVMLSTGMADLKAVRRSQAFIEGQWARAGVEGELALLHCVSAYPAPPGEANLGAIRDLANLGVTVGYSDHTVGLEAAVLAVALGARVVEKHFTLSHHHSDLRSHQLSADPAEFALLVQRIRDAELMIGSGIKAVAACEEDTASASRRSLCAAWDLVAGQPLSWEDLDWLRPGGGLAPGQEDLVLGRRLKRALGQGEQILLADLA
jgi:sialic acid synthase SpsE